MVKNRIPRKLKKKIQSLYKDIIFPNWINIYNWSYQWDLLNNRKPKFNA